MSLPKEQNSQVHKQGPQADTTLESSLNGRRRCKGSVALISQANGQRRLFQQNVSLYTPVGKLHEANPNQSCKALVFLIPK